MGGFGTRTAGLTTLQKAYDQDPSASPDISLDGEQLFSITGENRTTAGIGAGFSLTASDADLGTGGAFLLQAGNSAFSSDGGAFNMHAGDSTGGGDGGTFLMKVGDNLGGSGDGGDFSIVGGDGDSGGVFSISGGTSNVASGGTGGRITFTGGLSSVSGRGGDIRLFPGPTFDGGDTDGNVVLGRTSPVIEGLVIVENPLEMKRNSILFSREATNDGTLTHTTLTADRTWTFPNITGTIGILPIGISDTDLAVSSPITLSGGNTIGFDFSTNNIWSGTNTYQEDVTMSSTSGGGSFFYDVSTGQINMDLADIAGSLGFLLEKTETVEPTTPKYFDLEINRSYTGGQLLGTVMNIALNDTRTLNSGGQTITKLFNFDYNMAGLTGHTNAENPVGIQVNFKGAPTYTASTYTSVLFGLGTDGTNAQTWAPAFDEAGARLVNHSNISIGQSVFPSNAGAGLMTLNYRSIRTFTNFGAIVGAFDIGPDVVNFYGHLFDPASNIGGGTTMTSYGTFHDPNHGNIGGTVNSYILWAERDNIILNSDSSRIQFGAGQDSEIGFDGTNFVINSQLVGSGDVTFPNDNQALNVGAGGDARIFYNGTDLSVDAQNVGSGDVLFPNDNQALALGAASGGDSRVYWNGTDLIIDPDAGSEGSGTVLIGATGDDQLECANFIFPDYASVTLTAISDPIQTEFNVFDEDNFAALTTDANLTARGITYTTTDGNFDVAKAGVYNVECMFVANTASSQNVRFLVRVNGSVVYSYVFRVHVGVDPAIFPVTLILNLAASDNITFHMDAQSAVNLTANLGTTANIFQIAT